MEEFSASSNGDSEDSKHDLYVQRNIHFWKMEIMKEEENGQIQLDPWDVISDFNNLVYERASERSKYVQFHPKRYDVIIEAKIDKNDIIDVVFGRINQTNLPSIERKGKSRPIVLKDDEGLFIISHIQIHPDGVVLKESVDEGPSMAAFRRYILKRNNLNVKEVNLNRIAHEDFIRILPYIEEVKFLDIAVARKMSRTLSALDESLGGLFAAAQDWADFEQWAIIGAMKDSKRRPPSLGDFWKNIKKVMMEEDLRKKLERFRVGVRLAEEEETRMLDLLQAHLSDNVLVKRMDRDSKNSENEDISAKMKDTYRRRKPKEGNEWLLVDDDSARTVQETLDAG